MWKYKTKLKKQDRTKAEHKSSLIASIHFTKPMQIELSQLPQRVFRVKVQSNAWESSIESISKLFEIANYVGRSSIQSVIKFQN